MNSGPKKDPHCQDPRIIWVGPRLSDITDCEDQLFSGSITTYGLNAMLDHDGTARRNGSGAVIGIPPMPELVKEILAAREQGGPRSDAYFNIAYQESGLCTVRTGKDGAGTERKLRVNHNNADPLRDIFIFLNMADILHQAGASADRIRFMSYDPSTLDFALESDFLGRVLSGYLEWLVDRKNGWSDMHDRITRLVNGIRRGEPTDVEGAKGHLEALLTDLSGIEVADKDTIGCALHSVSNLIRRHTLCLNDSVDLVSEINDKTSFRRMCEEVGVPTVENMVIDPHEDSHTYQMLRKYIPRGTIVLQNIRSSEGNKTFLVREPANKEERDRTDARIDSIMSSRGRFILSRYRDPSIPVNVHALISDDTVSITRPSLQILDTGNDMLLNCGNDFPAFEQVRIDRPEMVEQMNTYVEWICKALQGKGYRGIIGFDLLLGDRVEFIEANACFQPSTALLNRALAENHYEHGEGGDSPYLRRDSRNGGVSRCVRKGEERKPSMHMLNLLSFYDVDLDTDDKEHARRVNGIIEEVYERCHGRRDEGGGTLRLPMTSSEFRALPVPFSRIVYRAPNHPAELGYRSRSLRHQAHILRTHRENIGRPLELIGRLMALVPVPEGLTESPLTADDIELYARHARSLVNLAQYIPENRGDDFRKVADHLGRLRNHLRGNMPQGDGPDQEHTRRMMESLIGICDSVETEGTFRSPEPVSESDNPDLDALDMEKLESSSLLAEPGAYLFAVTFRRNITSTQCDRLQIHPCLTAPSRRWDGLIDAAGGAGDRTSLLPLKIALMNEGARLSAKTLENVFPLEPSEIPPADNCTPSGFRKAARRRNRGFVRNLRFWGDSRFGESPSISFDAELPCGEYDHYGRRMTGVPVKIPLNNDIADYSPFSIELENGFVLRHYGERVTDLRRLVSNYLVEDGGEGSVPLEAILSQEPGNIEVRQSHTCMHVINNRGCRFCKYTSSKLGPESHTIFDLDDIHAALSASNLKDRARSEVSFNDISLSIGGGTMGGTEADRTRRITSICGYIRETFGPKRVLVKCVPPNAHSDLDEYRHAGVTSIMMNLELFDRKRATKFMPGKSVVPTSTYLSTLRHAVALWPLPGSVMSGLILGLEPDASFLEGVQHLASIGVSPVISVFHPLAGTALEDLLPPSSEHVYDMHGRALDICEECFVPLGPSEIMSQFDKVVIPDDRTARMLDQGLNMRHSLNGGI
ncbi:MAG: hypothetical protein MJZ38_04700 [archaeon]|nr:hypothetical protein [archaeon]